MAQKKERALSKAEQRRKERFKAQTAALEQQGYRMRPLTVGAVKANVLAFVVMLPFAAGLFACYLWKNHTFGAALSPQELLWLFALLFVLLAAHEGIHGLVWSLFAPTGFRSIEFGMVWSTLSPYCTCAEPMQKWQYILGSAMPTLVLGFGLGAAAVCLGSSFLFLISAMMLLGGGGDFYIILKLLLDRPAGEAIYCDHPYEVGLVVFERAPKESAAEIK